MNVQPIRPGVVKPMPGNTIRVLLVVAPATAATLSGGLSVRGNHRIEVASRAGNELSATDPAIAAADVVVVEIDPNDAVLFDEFETFVANLAGKRPVVAAVRNLDVAATRMVLRAGAADVLAFPFATDEFDRVIGTSASTTNVRRVAAAPRQGKIVAFLGAIGGCGSTTLAVQAGIVWAANARVCLIDFDLQFGNAALYLDLRPKLSVFDVIQAGDRLDVEILGTIAEGHSSGLQVVASPTDMLPLDTVTASAVEQILKLAASTYDIVLLDLPCAWTTWSLRAIELSDVTLFVTSLSVPGIHQARRQLEIIATNNPGGIVHVVLNRVTHPLLGKVDLGETEKLLGRRIDHAIANDYPTVSAAIDGGKPYAAVKSRARVDKDLRAMVKSLAVTLDEAHR